MLGRFCLFFVIDEGSGVGMPDYTQGSGFGNYYDVMSEQSGSGHMPEGEKVKREPEKDKETRKFQRPVKDNCKSSV